MMHIGKHFLYLVFTSVVLFMYNATIAQQRCGTVEYAKSLGVDPQQREQQFEHWLQDKMLQQRSSRNTRENAAPYIIPVVVHVIHNGDAIGTGANISDAQIISQINVLNKDFRRQNSDASNTPSQFQSVAGNLDIQFVLANRDEEGLPTNGIVRVNGGRSSWTRNDDYELKSLSYWPSEQYLNIWVCNLTDFLGYAQFPTASTLDGLANASNNPLTDGVVIWHRSFGSIDDGNFSLDPSYNKGRTTTHEVGHFFGLRHIWGDDNDCTGSEDYVNDTPNQSDATQNCPVHPQIDCSNVAKMFQNYMDYTDDVCMNLFTQGQIARMITVLENSPRRLSLTQSSGDEPPTPVANDLGIRTVITPNASVCSNTIIPAVEIRNYGNNNVNSARLRLTVDGLATETKDVSLNLSNLQSTNVSFNSIFLASGTHNLLFEILLTNGVADGEASNNTVEVSSLIPVFALPPLAVDFNTTPNGWVTQNPDGQTTWQIVQATKETSNNQALGINYFDYEDREGEVDIFLSPVIDLSTADAASLSFDVAHARFQTQSDRLKVIVLRNCEDIRSGTTVYDKQGAALATTSSTTNRFTPSNNGQWRRELVNMTQFAGEARVQIAFVGINDYGNNIYIDNISFFTENDLALIDLVSPSAVTCDSDPVVSLQIQNIGVTNFNVQLSVNNGPTQTVAANVNASTNEPQIVSLSSLSLAEGINTININLVNPTGTDPTPSNNQKQFTVVVNDASDRIPLRENFEGNFSERWTTVNQSQGMTWQPTATNFGQSMFFNAFDNLTVPDKAWLVSPVLDFSNATEATLVFDLSRVDPADQFSIYASTDCGNTYQEIENDFSFTGNSATSWLPATAQNWRENVEVDLSAYAGEQNVRLAFVAENGNGNNVYVDNIEFFTEANPVTTDIQELFTIYGYDLEDPLLTELKITFNLEERQDVRYTLISLTGQIQADGILTDVLNQTFPLNSDQRLAPGVYIVRVQIGGRFYSKKILIPL